MTVVKNAPVLQPDYAPASVSKDLPSAVVTASDGFVVVDKPLGMTSHDVVAKLRRLAGTRKVGHAGTLDPAASGILVLGIGRATKLMQYVQGLPKTYTARVCLGLTTTTEDAEGDITSYHPVPQDLDLSEYLHQFKGRIPQVPSAVSAKKIAGKRAYDLVREGKEFTLDPVEIEIYELKQISPLTFATEEGRQLAYVDLEVTCSAGTYVRALARDLGKAIGCGAHLTALRRTAVGPFNVAKEVFSLAELAELVAQGKVIPTISASTISKALFPVLEIEDKEIVALSYGQLVERAEEPERADFGANCDVQKKTIWAACTRADSQLGLAEALVALIKPRGANWQPVLVWQTALKSDAMIHDRHNTSQEQEE